MLIHFWELPKKRTYVLLNEKSKTEVVSIMKNNRYKWKYIDRVKNKKISIDKLEKIVGKRKMSLESFENNIIWIGGKNSCGILNPKLPFSFSSRNGTRFISALINDGCLTKDNSKKSYGRLMYDNFDKSLRESVLNDYLSVFGGEKNEVAFRTYENKKFLEFSSIVRDTVKLIIKESGPKCESNLSIPSFVFVKKENALGWIEQTIADEGEVKDASETYRRAIVWRRSVDITNKKQKCKLIEDEMKILDRLGINYRVHNTGDYMIENKKLRTRYQIYIGKRPDLLILRRLITIPSETKDRKFSILFEGYKRFKEVPKIRRTVIDLCRKNRTISPKDLTIAMNYKTSNTAIKWIKRFEKEGMIKKVKEPEYGAGYRKPAEYRLILSK